jgi:glycosyltransferase involved in cell wall biosynthesis
MRRTDPEIHLSMSASIPRVSVLMTTHNGVRTISESIGSILAQDMPDFELVVVDDASSDKTPDLLRSIIDPRLVIIRNDLQLGIAGARNRGLEQCRASYIAALDHDDLSDPRRLGLQTSYLDAHPEVVLVGTAVRELRDGKLRPEDQPAHTSPGLMRLLLHVDNPLAWSSVMLRNSALRALDRPPLRSAFEPADDFDLYHRLLVRGKIARLDEPLTTYRWHASNFSNTAGARMADGAARVLTRAYEPLLGAEAAAAAALIVRHGNDRVTITDNITMMHVRGFVNRLVDGLADAYVADSPEILAGGRQVLWRLSRASVRSGYPSLVRLPAPSIDAAISIALGIVRAGFHGFFRSH